ncbi:MAG: HAD-IA family hydrolase [Ignavibacteriales bacterium]|nr:HAD-IA family hydrolase [Ignavibacteriales bacterium]MCB9210320.1 HAD-IA family hydrolase [Ignavibacteriales bacterium]MCB9219125.1 HAD-IA family hydrolase [Ignavibacteriales bacterium]
MMRRTYTTIVFDLGNVLIPFSHNLWIENFNKISEGIGDKFYQKFKDNYNIHRDYESGKISDEEIIEIGLDWLEHKVTREQFLEIYANIFTFNQNVIDLLPILKRKYKLVLLSNTSGIHQKYGWEKYSFIKNFDKLILSHEVGAVKPEEKIYKAVEEFTLEKSETHIFIDDILDYVNAAKTLGWDGIQFVGYENLENEFKLRNIL